MSRYDADTRLAEDVLTELDCLPGATTLDLARRMAVNLDLVNHALIRLTGAGYVRIDTASGGWSRV